MKKLILLSLLVIIGSGCFLNAKKHKETEEVKKEKVQEQKFDDMDWKLHYKPDTDTSGSTDPLVFDFGGKVTKVPARTEVIITKRAIEKKKQSFSSYLSILTEYDATPKSMALIFFGVCLLAGAAILVLKGETKYAIYCGAAGLVFLVCGVLVNNYPGVFLVLGIMGIGAIGFGVYKLIIEHRKNRAATILSRRVDKLKEKHPELVEEFITQPIKDHEDAEVIRAGLKKIRK